MNLINATFNSKILLAILFSSCAIKITPNFDHSNIEDQKKLIGIVGGQITQDRDEISTHVVLITFEEKVTETRSNVSTGTGVIISNRFIVTAAHIFKGINLKSNSQGSGVSAYLNFGLKRRSGSRQEFYATDILNKSASEVSDSDYLNQPGHADYIFIRIPNGLPPGYSKMELINDKNFIKSGDKIKVAGYGLTNNDVNDFTLRTLDMDVSSTESNQARMPISKILNPVSRNYFLESITNGSHRPSCGDSGGPVYYEFREDGQVKFGLAAIHTNAQYFNPNSSCRVEDSESCQVADYGLRVDAFYDDAMRTARSLVY